MRDLHWRKLYRDDYHSKRVYDPAGPVSLQSLPWGHPDGYREYQNLKVVCQGRQTCVEVVLLNSGVLEWGIGSGVES